MSANTIPSLFDFQVNGFAGIDFQASTITSADLRHACDALQKHHTHRIFLTLITNTIDDLARQFERIEGFRKDDSVISETIAGYHLEGPYLSPAEGYAGAHDPTVMKAPDITEFYRLQEAAQGHIRLVTIAPELPGSGKFIRALRERGVFLSMGHTNASGKDIEMAIEAGATLCTHLGNGVPQDLHRHYNIIQRFLCRDELTACFIPDGIHLPPGVLRSFFRAKPAGKVFFTTDCACPAGAPPGRYHSLGVDLEVGEDRVVRVPGYPNFAGSSLSLDQGAVNISAWLGISLQEAWAMCSTRPAGLFGIDLPEIPNPTGLPSPSNPPDLSGQGHFAVRDNPGAKMGDPGYGFRNA